MAEYMFRHRMQGPLPLRAVSAGTSAVDGMRASREAVRVLEEWGIDMGGHRSRALRRSMLEDASRVIVMTPAHSRELALNFPEFNSKVSVLTSYDPASKKEGIADPIGMPIETYREVRDRIWDGVEGLVRFLGRQINTD
jgi:protein-tyrosine-phosphatase